MRDEGSIKFDMEKRPVVAELIGLSYTSRGIVLLPWRGIEDLAQS
jgi:hypothetical protein